MQEKNTLLFVGDNPENFPEPGKVADHIGIEYLHASSCEEAVQFCNQEPVALIVACACSTSINVEELVEITRDDSEGRDIPMIIINGDANMFLPRSADEGPLEIMAVDVHPHLLVSRIRMMIDWYNQRLRIQWLEEENERLDVINKQVRKFVGNVAHDLRGPLGKLINTSEVLLSGVEPEALNTFYEMIAQTSRRGFNLVNDILDITALESGQLQLYFEKCDLAEISEQVFQELNYLAQSKGQTLTNGISDALYVRGDRRRLVQIIANLVNNAIKFTPRGGTITIRADVDDNIRVCVSDSGVGIPPEKLSRLFHKHVKNSTPGTEGEQGTGFGLPLAQEIAMAHNSVIEVSSQEGKGSCFSFPLAQWHPQEN